MFLWTVLYQCASCTERVSTTTLVHKIKQGTQKNWGRGPLPTGLLLVLSFLTDISMSAAFGCYSFIAICLYGHCSNDMHFLNLVLTLNRLTGCCFFLCADIIG